MVPTLRTVATTRHVNCSAVWEKKENVAVCPLRKRLHTLALELAVRQSRLERDTHQQLARIEIPSQGPFHS